MEVLVDSYLDHFDQYGCKYYKSSELEIDDLDARDLQWLTQVGLPDGAIPFFFFDFYIGLLRDVKLPNCKLVLGTAFEPASRHYVFLNQKDQVCIQMKNGHCMFVNSSIRQLCSCIYQYSSWLEQQEDMYKVNEDHIVGDAEMFELYYNLRETDRYAFEKDSSIWPQLVHSKVDFVADYEA